MFLLEEEEAEKEKKLLATNIMFLLEEEEAEIDKRKYIYTHTDRISSVLIVFISIILSHSSFVGFSSFL